MGFLLDDVLLALIVGYFNEDYMLESVVSFESGACFGAGTEVIKIHFLLLPLLL